MASALTLQDLPALADYTREREHFRSLPVRARLHKRGGEIG